MADTTLSKGEIENEAIGIVKGEVDNYKDAQFFVTEKVSFVIRPLIRKLRKNYWGVLDQPKDPVTGKNLTFVPYTALVVDTVRKQADMDLKDIDFVSNNGRDGIPMTSLVRGFVRDWGYSTQLGEALNLLVTDIAIDGTEVWKLYEVKQGGKTRLKRRRVDLLNCYIDPTADSIQDASRFTERALMRPDEIKQMTDWQNTDEMTTARNLSYNEQDLLTSYQGGEYIDVYETWGLIPERLITGNKKDTELVQGRIVVSGLDTGDMRVHKIEKNTRRDKEGNIVKPYEEAWYMKMPGCWYGISPAWKVMGMQEYLNEIVNMRRKQNRVASLGLFKVKQNSGVTQQMLSNLVSQGVIQLQDMSHFEQLPINGAGEHSYRDEDIAKMWGFEVTSTNDITRGGSMPSTTTATTAVIEDRNSSNAFILVRENIGLFLQRYFDRHVIPHLPKLLREQGVCRIHGDFDKISQIRERVIANIADEMLDSMFEGGEIPTEEELTQAMDLAEQRLIKDGDLFFDSLEDILIEGIDTKVRFTNEEMDVAVTISNLLQLMPSLPPDVQRDVVIQTLDLMGLEVPTSLNGDTAKQQFQQMAQGFQQPDLSKLQLPTEQGITTAANVQGMSAIPNG